MRNEKAKTSNCFRANQLVPHRINVIDDVNGFGEGESKINHNRMNWLFNNSTPLGVAVYNNELKEVIKAINETRDIELSHLNRLLHVAVSNGNADIVAELLQQNVDIEWIEDHGEMNTPLLLAAKNNNLEVVDLLIKKEANIEAANRYRRNTPLAYAILNNNPEMVDLLIKARANVNSTVGLYRLPILRFAIIGGNAEIVSLLLNAGADYDAVDNWGNTPLHDAVGKNNKEIVALLINAGANFYAEDHAGGTALNVAARLNDNNQMLKFIRETIINRVETIGRMLYGSKPEELINSNKSSLADDEAPFSNFHTEIDDSKNILKIIDNFLINEAPLSNMATEIDDLGNISEIIVDFLIPKPDTENVEK